MVLLHTPICEFGLPIIDFSLPGADGKNYTLQDCKGPKGTLVMFICNHCPYVQAIWERLITQCETLKSMGIYSVAINANDAEDYPEDSFEAMQALVAKMPLPFPYLRDEDQSVARAYQAVCTPDFFGYNADGALQYRGRLDSCGREAADPNVPQELLIAMRQVAETGKGPASQVPSMGCSIKWKDDA